MSTYTPGPWHKSNTKCGGYIFSDSLSVNIAEVFNLSGFGTRGEDDANARLIAAAPELLEALENMLEAFSPDIYRMTAAQFGKAGEAEIASQNARTAIAKAKGEEPK